MNDVLQMWRAHLRNLTSQNNIHYFENVGHTWYNSTGKRVIVPGSELSLARQENPVMLKDCLEFFYIK
jgi:hypothetical protein